MGERSSRTSASPARRTSRLQALAPPAPGASTRVRLTRGRSVLSEATVRREHSGHDMRRKRPPALSFLLRMATARRVARVLSLLALDFAGVALALFTALMLKAVVRDHVAVEDALNETERLLTFVYLLTALLF